MEVARESLVVVVVVAAAAAVAEVAVVVVVVVVDVVVVVVVVVAARGFLPPGQRFVVPLLQPATSILSALNKLRKILR